MNIKTESKVIADLEKERGKKRDDTIKSNAKRTETVGELKRKTNNLKGQVN